MVRSAWPQAKQGKKLPEADRQGMDSPLASPERECPTQHLGLRPVTLISRFLSQGPSSLASSFVLRVVGLLFSWFHSRFSFIQRSYSAARLPCRGGFLRESFPDQAKITPIMPPFHHPTSLFLFATLRIIFKTLKHVLICFSSTPFSFK